MHDTGILGNGICYFQFVGKPITKCRCICSMFLHFISYLISFQNMCKRIKTEIKFLRHTHSGSNFTLYIRVAGNESFAIHNFYQCIQFKISSYRQHFTVFRTAFISLHISLIIGRPGKGIH